ncbi:MAG: hypothetical protein LBF22_10620, partial [Deltaproteobacteria bacterium]|nr:hypothetical protein [Deltaproteobacteria bacterium]
MSTIAKVLTNTANFGLREAQTKLFGLLQIAYVFPFDIHAAIGWFKKALEHGNIEAFVHLKALQEDGIYGHRILFKYVPCNLEIFNILSVILFNSAKARIQFAQYALSNELEKRSKEDQKKGKMRFRKAFAGVQKLAEQKRCFSPNTNFSQCPLK